MKRTLTALFFLLLLQSVVYSQDSSSTCTKGDCCVVAEQGCSDCEDEDLEACVCAKDPYCCRSDGHWDSTCVSKAFSECGSCRAEEPCLVERCCSQTSSELSCRGCVDEEIQQIVCEKDVTCCVDKWDRFCAEKAITYSTRCNTGSSSTSSSSNNSNESNGEDGSETWEQQPDEEESGLSNAEVFGIVFGVLLLFIIVIFLTFTVVVLYIKWRAPVVVRA